MAAKKLSSTDDDYWESSSAQKIKKKGNLFDDEINVDEAKTILQSNQIDFDDDDDTINWDGSAAATKIEFSAAKSARHRPSGGQGATQNTQAAVGGIPIGTNRPSALHKHSMSRPSEGDFPLTASNSTLSDHVIKPQQSRAAPTHSEVAKLESEINALKRTLHATKKDKYSQIPPREMIQRMMLGDAYSLEGYKAKEQKISLLEEAIKSHDGNSITAVVVFLRDTIKASIFQRLLLQRPVAVEHYINYLRLRSEYEKLDNLLGMLGRFPEAAMIKYKQALATSSAETKIRQLQTCQRVHFTDLDQGLGYEAGMIQQHVALLERQLPVENADKMEETKGLPPFRDFPRACSVVGMPVVTTLYYCSMYHYGITENYLASPAGVRKAHGLSDAQYVWTIIRALVKVRRWKDIETLFQAKGWLGGTKMKAIVPFDRVVHLLNSLQAPREVKNKYCNLIDDTRLRLETAQKFECHESLIETYMHLKDRQALIAFQSKLKANSQEWFFACDALRNSNIKWKN